MDVGIPVEVEGIHGEFYPALVCGLNSLEEYRVKLLDSSHASYVAEVCLSPRSMRLPPDLTNFPFDPTQGQEVDVFIPSFPLDSNTDDSSVSSPIAKLSAWWPGLVKKVGGGFVIVELVSIIDRETCSVKSVNTIEVVDGRINIPPPSSVEKTDIVEKHQLRPRSHQTNFLSDSLKMHSIDIPDELEPYCKDPGNYQHFARRCGLPVLVCMAPDTLKPVTPVESKEGNTFEKKARLLVISPDISTIKRAVVIDNTFIDMLRQKVLILQQTEELSRKLEASRVAQAPAPFVLDVYVPENLMSYAIGFQNCNIRRAGNIPGILSIKLNRQACLLRISGKTEEAVQQAKAMLDYTTEVILVPRQYVNLIVGSRQRHIQHIVDCLGLRGLKICDTNDGEQNQLVPFQLTGISQAIRDAKMFLEFHIASLQELDKLRGVKCPPCTPSLEESNNDRNPIIEPEFSKNTISSSRKRDDRLIPDVTSEQSGLTNGCADPVDVDEEEKCPSNDQENDKPKSGHEYGLTDSWKTNQRTRQRRPQNMHSNNNDTGDDVSSKSINRKVNRHLVKISSGATEFDGYQSNLSNGTVRKSTENGGVKQRLHLQ